jgi:23S rRNA (pseudouridine1915-N3)-methyltransferase
MEITSTTSIIAPFLTGTLWNSLFLYFTIFTSVLKNPLFLYVFMRITLLVIGKTSSKELISLMEVLEKRLPPFIRFERRELPDVKNAKNLSETELKNAEADLIISHLESGDTLIILDEKGTEFTSVDFSRFLDQQMNNSVKHLIFCVGGAWGFSDKIYHLKPQKIALSKMTFTHQMVRLFFVEQLYRAFSILQGKPYHNE